MRIKPLTSFRVSHLLTHNHIATPHLNLPYTPHHMYHTSRTPHLTADTLTHHIHTHRHLTSLRRHLTPHIPHHTLSHHLNIHNNTNHLSSNIHNNTTHISNQYEYNYHMYPHLLPHTHSTSQVASSYVLTILVLLSPQSC